MGARVQLASACTTLLVLAPISASLMFLAMEPRWKHTSGHCALGSACWVQTTGKSCALQNEAFGSKSRGTSSLFSCQPYRNLCNTFTLWHLKRARVCYHSFFICMHFACAPCIYSVPVASLGLPRSLTGLPCWQHLPWETVGFPDGGDAGHIPTAEGRSRQGCPRLVRLLSYSSALSPGAAGRSLEHPI